jgi:AcrR family transcriptional regulator
MSDEKLDGSVRRQQIAEAALTLVADCGLNRLSVAAVARRVGLVPSGIYRHFKSKDEILLAVLDRMEARLIANVRAALDESPDPLERLRGLLVRHIRMIREGRAIPRIIFSDEVHGGHPDRKARVRQMLNGYLGHIGQLVRQGQEEGKVRPEVDPGTVALLFMGMIVPAGIVWHLTDGGFDVTRHAQRAWELFRRAISTESTDQGLGIGDYGPVA